ncbi:MAG: hypothetical protein H0V92_11630 [Pseudonocardiales bacterium]|nr:hypothetical protein [Pseudonocardiales bacterium]
MTGDQILLLEAFEDAVAPDGCRPDRELLADLAGCYDAEVRDTLLGMLAELTERDLPTARRCAGHLGRLAALLPATEATALRTGRHLIIGEAAAYAELWPEASWRMRKAQADLGSSPFADRAPVCELVLGEVADGQGDALRQELTGRPPEQASLSMSAGIKRLGRRQCWRGPPPRPAIWVRTPSGAGGRPPNWRCVVGRPPKLVSTPGKRAAWRWRGSSSSATGTLLQCCESQPKPATSRSGTE